MRVAFLTSGRLVPSSRFRVLPFVPHLECLGHECLVLPSRPEKYAAWPLLGFRLSHFVKRWHRWSDLATLERWSPDVVVLERELFSDDSFDIEQALRSRVRRLVLDIDDGLFVLHRHKFEVLCGLSDHIIAGNELLAVRSRMINPRVTVIPTSVDLDRYRPAERRQPTAESRRTVFQPPHVLGWTGTAANIEYLEVLREPLKQLAREFPIELRVIAESDRPLRRLGFDREGIATRFVRWSAANEVTDLGVFDIGLMPMPDTDWTRYKCGLKILQYMAVGIPAVASPVGVNSEIIHHGVNGWLATTPDEWLFVLRQLVSEPARRAAVIEAARNTVEQRYAVTVQLPRLIACLEGVCGGQ
ncbi:MAG: glycosyltransferase family 4 protein [Planctomycetaceae bacterium]